MPRLVCHTVGVLSRVLADPLTASAYGHVFVNRDPGGNLDTLRKSPDPGWLLVRAGMLGDESVDRYNGVSGSFRWSAAE